MSRKKLKGSIDISRGHQTLRVSPWVDAKSGTRRWRFSVIKAGKRVWITRSTKDEASAAAEAWLNEAPEGVVFSALPAPRRRFLEHIHREVEDRDEQKVIEFIQSLRRSGEVVAAVERFISNKLMEAGEATPHLTQMSAMLRGMSGHFSGKLVAEIHLEELQKWWLDRCEGLGWKRKKDVRAALVQFWKWARKNRLAGNEPDTVAECLPKIEGKAGEREIIEDFEVFKLVALNIKPQYRSWLVLGGFEGLRPEEIAPARKKKEAKRGLLCEEIDWKWKIIKIAEETSKVDTPRNPSMNEACMLGLEWAGIREGMKGPVCLKNPAVKGETKRLGELVFPDDWPVANLRGKRAFPGGWPSDVLRHTYASYRIGVVQEFGPVAMEMGTSEKMLKEHYNNPRAKEEGLAWFEQGAEFFRLLLTPLKSGADTADNGNEEKVKIA